MRLRVRKNSWIIVCLILLLALFLRFWRFDNYPIAGETKDEFAWTWLGDSLLRGQPPTSWSWFDEYENEKLIELAGDKYRIVYPVFDNPPLFSLIPGFMVRLLGDSGIVIPSIRVVRFPMVILGVLNVFLLYILVREYFDEKLGLLASLIYATVPTFVFSSRLVVAENLLITWMLLSIIIVKKYIDKKRGYQLLILGILGGLSLLTKVTGVVIPIYITSWLGIHDDWKGAGKYTLITGLVASLWLVYASVFGWSMFWKIQLSQGARSIGWGTAINQFLHHHVSERPLMDGWTLLGLIVMIALVIFYRKIHSGMKPLVLIFIYWLLVLMLSTAEQTWHGWYRFPLFPIFSVALAWTIAKAKENTLIWLPICLLAVLPSLRMLIIHQNGEASTSLVRIVFLLVFGLSLIPILFKPSKKYGSWLATGMVIVLVVVNIGLVLSFDPESLTGDNQIFYESY